MPRPRLFSSETESSTRLLHDPAKNKETAHHQRLQNPDNGIVSPEKVINFGEMLVREIPSFSQGTVFTEKNTIPFRVMESLVARGNHRFFAQLCLGAQKDEWYLATGRVTGSDMLTRAIELQIVPVSIQSLEKSKFEKHQDTTLLLAAAALSASTLPDVFQDGLTTQECSTKQQVVTTVTPSHAGPLATTFDSWRSSSNVFDGLKRSARKLDPSLSDLTHLHGVPEQRAAQSRIATSQSGLAAGLELTTLSLANLPGPYALYVRHFVNDHGKKDIMNIPELFPELSNQQQLAQVAAALAFTAHVIGEIKRENMLEDTFQVKNADVPMRELLQKVR